MRIAIVGSGISGLMCAHLLSRRHDVVLFEAEPRPGGHSHTHHLRLADADVDVDTGFIVYNDRTYPLFCRFLDRLGIETQPANMSFGVADPSRGIEWRGTSPSTVFAQRRNIVRLDFLRMLVDVARFNRLALAELDRPTPMDLTLERALAPHRWSKTFLDWYLAPLGSSIWSAAPSSFMSFPFATVARFFERHGLLRLGDQPHWRTVTGGSAQYVEAVVGPLRRQGRLRTGCAVEKVSRSDGGVEVVANGEVMAFDHVVIATHSDQALALLSDPDRAERSVLGAVRYQPNRATLHTDAALMPANRRAWASWNYRHHGPEASRTTLTYHLNSLQNLPTSTPVLVTLNQDEVIDPDLVLASMDYEHPVLDTPAVAAQSRHSQLNGRRRTWFCGAYWGYGFHEDGARSAVATCRALGVEL